MTPIIVHDLRIMTLFNFVISPIVRVLMTVVLLQSFGIELFAVSYLSAPPDWATRALICATIYIGGRQAITALKAGPSSRVMLIVNSQGIETPDRPPIAWGQLRAVSQSFGWIGFEPKSPSNPGFKIWAFAINQTEWKKAKTEIQTRLNEEK